MKFPYVMLSTSTLRAVRVKQEAFVIEARRLDAMGEPRWEQIAYYCKDEQALFAEVCTLLELGVHPEVHGN